MYVRVFFFSNLDKLGYRGSNRRHIDALTLGRGGQIIVCRPLPAGLSLTFNSTWQSSVLSVLQKPALFWYILIVLILLAGLNVRLCLLKTGRTEDGVGVSLTVAFALQK